MAFKPTYLINPWNMALLEKLTGLQQGKKFTALLAFKLLSEIVQGFKTQRKQMIERAASFTPALYFHFVF